MSANKNATEGIWNDPDDAPELTDKWFEGATLYENAVLAREPRRAEPSSGTEMNTMTIGIDRRTLHYFRAKGDDWPDRIREILRQAAARGE